ncbi:MAG: tetratricopeptide repeat protein [Anaerolineae bacterium]|nr:tetratricopeptide repeat protein [Anaerolineae bacterium]
MSFSTDSDRIQDETDNQAYRKEYSYHLYQSDPSAAIQHWGDCFQRSLESWNLANCAAMLKEIKGYSLPTTSAIWVRQFEALYYSERGEWQQARACLERNLQACRTIGDVWIKASTMAQLAMGFEAQGRHPEAIRLYNQARLIFERLDDKDGMMKALTNLAAIYSEQGLHEKAILFLEDGLRLSVEIGDREGVLDALRNLIAANRQMGRYIQSTTALERTLRLQKALRDITRTYVTERELASLLSSSGTVIEDRTYHEAQLELCSEQKNQKQASVHLRELSRLAYERGDYALADTCCRSCLELAEELDDQFGQAQAIRLKGMIAQAEGNDAQARQFFDNSLGLSKECGNIEGIVLTLQALGNLQAGSGKNPQALKAADQALSVAQAIRASPLIVSSLLMKANFHRSDGEYTLAETCLHEALSTAGQSQDRVGRARALLALGKTFEDQELYPQSRGYYLECLRVANKSGDEVLQSEMLMSMGLAFAKQGDLGQAMEYLQESLQLARKLRLEAGVAECAFSLGGIFGSLGERHLAVQHLTRARDCFRALRASQRVAQCDSLLDALDRGIATWAIPTWPKMLVRILNPEDYDLDKKWQPDWLLLRASRLRAKGSHELSIVLLQRCIGEARLTGDQLVEAAACSELGFAWYNLTDYEQAEDAFRCGLLLVTDREAPVLEATNRLGLGLIFNARGLHDEAYEQIKNARCLYASVRGKRWRGSEDHSRFGGEQVRWLEVPEDDPAVVLFGVGVQSVAPSWPQFIDENYKRCCTLLEHLEWKISIRKAASTNLKFVCGFGLLKYDLGDSRSAIESLNEALDIALQFDLFPFARQICQLLRLFRLAGNSRIRRRMVDGRINRLIKEPKGFWGTRLQNSTNRSAK